MYIRRGVSIDKLIHGALVRLTRFTRGLGCACKLRPQMLERILAELPVPDDADIIVGPETSDAAAVYRIDDKTAIIHTVDFFTPVVDDPYWFGAIAARIGYFSVKGEGRISVHP